MQHHVIAGLAVLAFAAPAAQAAEPETYFFECAGQQPVQKYQNPLGQAGVKPWSTTPPAGSFTSGAGCGFVDTAPVNGDRLSDHPGNQWDAWYRGRQFGAVGTVRVELHNLLVGRARTNGTRQLEVRLTQGEGFAHQTLARFAGPVAPVLSASGLTERYVVELSGLDLGATTAGRDLAVGVHSLEQAPQPWVHGASEVPASVTFVPPPAAR